MNEEEKAQQERATGAFVLVVEAAPADERSWKALRHALRLSRADVPWLKECVPGVVRRGAQSDLENVASRARVGGFQVRVVKKSDVT